MNRGVDRGVAAENRRPQRHGARLVIFFGLFFGLFIGGGRSGIGRGAASCATSLRFGRHGGSSRIRLRSADAPLGALRRRFLRYRLIAVSLDSGTGAIGVSDG